MPFNISAFPPGPYLCSNFFSSLFFCPLAMSALGGFLASYLVLYVPPGVNSAKQSKPQTKSQLLESSVYRASCIKKKKIGRGSVALLSFFFLCLMVFFFPLIPAYALPAVCGQLKYYIHQGPLQCQFSESLCMKCPSRGDFSLS